MRLFRGRKLIILVASLLLSVLYASNAEAFRRGGVGGSGRSLMNVGQNDLIPANLVNVLTTCNRGFATATDVTKVDADGYLTSSPTSNVSFGCGSGPVLWTGVQYKFLIEAGLQQQIVLNFAISSCAVSGANISISNCSGSGSNSITTTDAAGGYVTFTIVPGEQLSFYQPSGGTYSRTGSGKMAMYRVSDETRYLAGKYWTQEYIDVLKGLHLRGIRPMGETLLAAFQTSPITDWADRTPPSYIVWNLGTFPPRDIVGGGSAAISGTNTYTGAATPTTPVAWTNGETFIGVIQNTNTSTTVTFNINSRGAKTALLQNGLTVPAIGDLRAGEIVVGTYNSQLDKILLSCASGCTNNSYGIVSGVPIEAQVQLPNEVNVSLWVNIPLLASDAFATSLFTYIKNNLNAGLYTYFELQNEVWNPSFFATQLANRLGLTLGWPDGQAVFSWYGMRIRQLFGNTIPSVFGGSKTPGSVPYVRRVMAIQIAGDSDTITYRLNGTQLNSTSYPLYGTYTSGVNYDTFPNRPIDVVETLAGAPYAGGTDLCTAPDSGCTPNAYNAPFYQALVTAWEGGNTASAISMVSSDFLGGRNRVQNVTASGTTFTTPLAHNLSVGDWVQFQVTGGTSYSGLTMNVLYYVQSTPSSTTFTARAYVNAFPVGPDVNAGSAGSGTTTVGYTFLVNMKGLASAWMYWPEYMASLYDSARNGAGHPLLRVEWYEGNPEPQGPTAAQCTSLSITGSDCTGSIKAAILAWKNSSTGRADMQTYYKMFMGTESSYPATFGLMAHSVSPSHLVMPQESPDCAFGTPNIYTGTYSILSACLPNSTPVQLYYGIYDFNVAYPPGPGG